MRLGIRWTIGDVSDEGFETLANSIRGARAVFGDIADAVVCVNTIGIEAAQARLGGAAALVDWVDSTNLLPDWLAKRVHGGMAEGVGWKFAPVRVFNDRHLLALDNDVILWSMPESIRLWLEGRDTLLIAEDVQCCYGAFAGCCPAEPRNSGIVGLPPFWDFEKRLRKVLEETILTTECDEQGLQVAIITSAPHRVVGVQEVSITGYFRPHSLELGSCGAHFVGVNARSSAAQWQGRSVSVYAHEFWHGKKANVEDLVRLAQRHQEARVG